MASHDKHTRRVFLGTSGVAIACAFAATGARAALERPVRIGLVTDCHYAEREPANGRQYRASVDKLTRDIDFMNQQAIDCVVELGDFKDQDLVPSEQNTLAYLRRIESVFGRFKGPRYHVLGNHDMDSITKAQFQAEAENTGIDRVRTYYSFNAKGLHGIVLDANFRADGIPYARGDFDWTDANIPTAELDWLKRDLAAATGPVAVFVHQRLDGEGDLFVNNAAEVRTILEASGHVLAVFQGHDHPGARTERSGIPYFTLKATVEAPDSGAHAIAEFGPDGGVNVTGPAVAGY
ncbi:MAG: metallophosphoesterase [FCB group bacterium]|jgi:alkaline phosphatase|nr:metallophosphoesterase [FCB group bacterium]